MEDEYTDEADAPLERGYIERHDEPARPTTIAILWLPDPEARRGYREHYVNRTPPQQQPRRSIGFHAHRQPRRSQ